jgi:phosphohistidine phosphatase
MDLYLLRHAIAEERSNDGSDSARALTPEGG